MNIAIGYYYKIYKSGSGVKIPHCEVDEIDLADAGAVTCPNSLLNNVPTISPSIKPTISNQATITLSTEPSFEPAIHVVVINSSLVVKDQMYSYVIILQNLICILVHIMPQILLLIIF